MLTRRTFITTAAAMPAASMIATPALAAEPQVFSAAGLAIRGADPVCYFTEGMPCAGTDEHAVMWNGATWNFVSAQTMELFMADPAAYAPQYGGYCAFAMSRGSLATSVPEAWTIEDGKLYLNYSLNVRQVWLEDVPGNIVKANAQWPTVLG